MPNSDTSGTELALTVLEQGIEKRFASVKEVFSWLEEQRDFWGKFGDLMSRGLDLGNFGSVDSATGLQRIQVRWDEWQNQVRNKPDSASTLLSQIHDLAARFEIVIPDGIIGQQLKEMLDHGSGDDLKIAIFAFNTGISPLPSNFSILARSLRVVALINPIFGAVRDVEGARNARLTAEKSATGIKEKEAEFDRWIVDQERSIGKLSDRFKKELPFEKPAAHWRRSSIVNYSLVLLFLLIFMALVLMPAYVLYSQWQAVVKPFLDQLFLNSQSAVPVGPISILLVPIVAYGWFLKHISRMFIQSYALAVDAQHRRSLAITYLGLMDYEKTQITEAERAIILNALFRPAPPYGADDGPPMGLMDLIRK